MRILQKNLDKLAAEPKALLVLQSIGAVPTYHERYGMRHPLASYNLSLLQVTKRINTTLDTLEEIQSRREFENQSNTDWEVQLIEATDRMLYALMEHIDDCNGIIRSFFASSNDSNFKKIYKTFKESVAPYRNHIGSIVNYLKHNQGRLRAICFSWPSGASLGYFVEGPIAGGGLGPVSTIHPNEDTAFSYNRDIPYHLCSLFAVSAHLATALHTVDSRLIFSKIVATNVKRPTELSQALEKAASLPIIFFEDEGDKGVPKITAGNRYFTIDYPANRAKPYTPPNGSKVRVSYRGDGVTRTYKVPYYNG